MEKPYCFLITLGYSRIRYIEFVWALCAGYRTKKKDRVVNLHHYRRLALKQTIAAENVLLEQGKVIDFPVNPPDLSRHDELLYE